MKQGKYIAGVCVLSAGLAGCVAPGMHMNSLQLTPAVNSNNQIVKPVVQTINAQLVQAQAEQTEQAQAVAKMHYHKPAGFTTQTSNYHYHVAAQDVLRIVVWNQNAMTAQSGEAQLMNNYTGTPGTGNSQQNNSDSTQNSLNNSYRIDGDGNIFYPYLGSIHVSGKTVEQIRALLVQKMAKYIDNPQITVQVLAFNSKKIAITGAIKNPMNISITNVPLNVLTAVTLAGGPISCNATSNGQATTFCADLHDVQIHRGKKTVLVNLNKLTSIDGSSNNWILKNGDIIYVPNNNESRIFVLGAVNATGPYNMIDGKMTLRDALGDAGGATTMSNPGYTYVVRNFGKTPEVYVLDLSSPDALNLAGDFALKPDDVVFISTSRLVDVANIINQVTPGLAAAAYAKSLTS